MLGSRSAPASFENEIDQKNFITAEFRLCQDPVDGIYICPLLKNPLEWKGIIMIRAGCYSGGTFRFSLYLPKNFPQNTELPIVKFDIYIFHPYIDPLTQELNLTSCFPNLLWKREKHKILDVLYYLQEIFAILTEKFPLDARSVVNKQAALLFIKDFDNFRLKAEEFVAMSRHTVYDGPKDSDDPHLIIFPPWESSKMEPIRRQLLGKSGPPTIVTNSSRTTSDFSSRGTSNGADGDDEQQEVRSNGSNHSFEEINLEIEERQEAITNSDGMSSIDLSSAPVSARVDGWVDDKVSKEVNRQIDVNGEVDERLDKKNDNEIDQEFALLDMVEQAQFSTNNNFAKSSNDNVKFKVGYSSSSSGPESIDEHETLTMHQKLQHSISIEPISESCNDVLGNETLKNAPRGVNARSVSLFNDVL